ncbi:MAG: ATP-binding cassette domain-containing protein [Pseudomonadota bacterium]
MANLTFDLHLTKPDITMTGALPMEGVTAIMGPSGSGKTTLLSMLAGLERRARGTVAFGDTAWQGKRRFTAPEARRIGMVFQDSRLFPHLTVLENIAYGAQRRKVLPANVHAVADAMGLRDLLHRHPTSLSGGEGRRVALARALATAPDILFLDEPLSGLDEASKARLLPYLTAAVSQSGIPAVYVTHSQLEVTQFADRVLLIEGGRVAGWGTPPQQLLVMVEQAGPSGVTVALGATRFSLPGQAEPGDARRIALRPENLLISEEDPGRSGAIVTLLAEVRAITHEPEGPVLTLGLAGQVILMPVAADSRLAGTLPSRGSVVWLSLMSAVLR